MRSAIQTQWCKRYVETDLLELRCAFPNGGRDRHRVGRMVGQNCETGVSIPHYLPSPSSPYTPSVRGGIQGSTEYGKLSIKAHTPRMAECSDRSESA